MSKRKFLKSSEGPWWGVTNFGILLSDSIRSKRRDAVCYAQQYAYENGISNWKACFEVRKLNVVQAKGGAEWIPQLPSVEPQSA